MLCIRPVSVAMYGPVSATMDRAHARPDGGVPTATDLDGQVAVASGGTDGIGKATATKLAGEGATTVLVGSTPERGRRAVSEIVAETGNENVEYLQADLSRMAEVRDLVDAIHTEYDRLDVLVHTAGIVPTEQETTEEGIERSFAINYLSRFLSTTLLEDRLRAGGPTRVVNVAAAGQNSVEKLDLDDLDGDRLFRDPEAGDHMVRGQGALDQAQVANDLFSLELAERLDGADVSVTVVNPGAVDTDIRLKAGEGWQRADEMIREEYGVLPPEQIAEAIVPLATVVDTGVTNGRFYGPQGDEREKQDGVDDPDLRQRLWEASERLAAETRTP
jgi:NAD(P)-dependent dehydrogenase (short-subunit alcohol dehydrogenase family)